MFKWKISLGIGMTVLAIGALSTTVLAAPQPKIDVCHYQDADVLDADGNIVDPQGWRIININGNALKAHEGVHTDGTSFDFVVDDSDADPSNDSAMCGTPSPSISS